MSEPTTLRCGLPLLQPTQAQKHVTVNDALMRLDGLTNLVLESVRAPAPPAVATDGECHGVPSGAQGAWSGQGGRIAIAANGGWVFADAQPGQRAFVRDQGLTALWDGRSWRAGAVTMGASGAGISAGLSEADVAIVPGAGFGADVFLPANTMILGVSARVIAPITGSLKSWSLGVSDAESRFGSGMGLGLNSYGRGLLSAPMAVYAAQNLRLTAADGLFEGGRVRLAIHWLELRLPGSV